MQPCLNQSVELDQLAKDINNIHRETLLRINKNDFTHLLQLERWGRLCTIFGYATAWIAPNPVSALLISQGIFTRWSQLTHPISHGAYDKITNVPNRYKRKGYAKGWRRWVDWVDWINPQGWHQEHNVLHHYHLGETNDPDQLQTNSSWLRNSKYPLWLRYSLVALFACIWKPAYYARATIEELYILKLKKRGEPRPHISFIDSINPFSSVGRLLWVNSLCPYIIIRFIIFPLLFLPLGEVAVTYVFINSVLAEVFTNLHSFVVIIPNHAGDDIPLFNNRPKNQGEFYLRQIIGSVNYPSNSNLNDFFYGWLNYQIEHHLWPDIPLSQYHLVQTPLQQICKKHKINYCQESVFLRLKKAINIMVGTTSMLKETPQLKQQTLK